MQEMGGYYPKWQELRLGKFVVKVKGTSALQKFWLDWAALPEFCILLSDSLHTPHVPDSSHLTDSFTS